MIDPSDHIVAGIDADTRRIAMAVMNARKVIAINTIERMSSRGAFRADYHNAINSTMRWFAANGVKIYLERPFLHPREFDKLEPNTFEKLTEIQGELKHLAQIRRVPLVTVAPTTWYNEVLGKVKGGRKALKKASMEKATIITKMQLTEHEADAVCVAIYGLNQLARQAKEQLDAREVQVIDVLDKLESGDEDDGIE